MTVIHARRIHPRVFPPVAPETLEVFKEALASAAPGSPLSVGWMREDLNAAIEIAMEVAGPQPRGESDWAYGLRVGDALLSVMPRDFVRYLAAVQVVHRTTALRRRLHDADSQGLTATHDDEAEEPPKRPFWRLW